MLRSLFLLLFWFVLGCAAGLKQDVLLQSPGTYYLQREVASAALSSSFVSISGDRNTILLADRDSPSLFTIEESLTVEVRGVTVSNATLGALPASVALSSSSLRSLTDRPGLSPPTAPFLDLPWLSQNATLLVKLFDVFILTDCLTLAKYQAYFCSGSWDSGQVVNSTHIFLSNWSSPLVSGQSIWLSCPYVSGIDSGVTTSTVAATCVFQDVNTPDLLRSAVDLQSTYDQVVVLLSGLIVLYDEGVWSSAVPRLNISKAIVIQGVAANTNTPTLDFHMRVNMWLMWSTGFLVLSNMTVRGLPMGTGITSIPLSTIGWNPNSYHCVEIPKGWSAQGPYIYAFSSTRQQPCDLLVYMVSWVNIAISPIASVRITGAWVQPMITNVSVQSVDNQYNMYWNYNIGPRGMSVNTWTSCGANLPDFYNYSGVLDFSNNAQIPATQMFGVPNATALLNQIMYVQANVSLSYNQYSLVIINNISFANVAPPNGSWPVSLTKNTLWARWFKYKTYVDFAGRSGLFLIAPGVVLQIHNLTLVGLPWSAHPGPGEVMWSSVLWPFMFDRSATARLHLLDVTLEIPQSEINFLACLLLNVTRSVGATMPTNYSTTISKGNGVVLGWRWVPLSASWRSATFIGGNVSSWMFSTLDGLGYETRGVTLVAVNASQPSAHSVAEPSYEEYQANYEAMLASQVSISATDSSLTSMSDNSSSHWVAIVVATVLGCVGAVLLAVGVVIVWQWHHRRCHTKDTKSSSTAAIALEMEHGNGISRVGPSQDEDWSGKPSIEILNTTTLPVDIMTEVRRQNCLNGDPDLVVGALLGCGSTSKVYEGRWRSLPVAIKTMPLNKHDSVAQAAQEVAVMHNIMHPNIVTCYSSTVTNYLLFLNQHRLLDSNSSIQEDFHNGAQSLMGTSDMSTLCVVMVQELCDRGCLRDAVDSGFLSTLQGAARLRLIWVLAWHVCQAMSHLHKCGVVHGDLNTNNILLKSIITTPKTIFTTPGTLDDAISAEGHEKEQNSAPVDVPPMLETTKSAPKLEEVQTDVEDNALLLGFCAKVTDFGLCQFLHHSQTHVSGILGGTMYYTAPEVLMQGQLKFAADVFSFGVVLWEMFHGTPPWRRSRTLPVINTTTIMNYRDDCPPALEALCKACTALDPGQRITFDNILMYLLEHGADWK